MPSDLVTVERFRDLPDALLAKGKLESGVSSASLPTPNSCARIGWSNLIGNMRLQVRAEDAADALALLQDPIPATFPTDEFGAAYDQPRCPKCNSLDIGFETINRFWSYILMWLGIPIPVRRNNWKCYVCGADWIERQHTDEPTSSFDSFDPHH